MTIIVAATDGQWKELTTDRTGISWQRVNDCKDFDEHKNADAFFCLNEHEHFAELGITNKPVFINSVIDTLAELKTPANVLRINGWPGFLSRIAWEIAGQVDEQVNAVFKALGKKTNLVADEPGFIAARIIAMIINEAYFAVEDNVSGKPEIDTAMKLGTNYPHGPFEWAFLIGTNNILALLQKLYKADARYQPAMLLIKEGDQNNQ